MWLGCSGKIVASHVIVGAAVFWVASGNLVPIEYQPLNNVYDLWATTRLRQASCKKKTFL